MIRFISAQPATRYYAWQVEVMLYNFNKIGIDLNYVDIVLSSNLSGIPQDWVNLSKKYAANFFFYPDTRKVKKYVSSIRPHLLKKHFNNNTHLENEVIFYHDSDMVLTRPINFSQFEMGDDWYGSDCKWYLGYEYILSKGEDVLTTMCEVCEIDSNKVKRNEFNTIGAQYVMKNLNAEFWSEVEKLSEELFTKVTNLNKQKKKENPKYHELQIWCADMWALLWTAWKRNIKTNCHKDLKFSWATSSEYEWEKYPIFHNAGVNLSHTDLFFKAHFLNELPYNVEMNVRKGTASSRYWELIREVGLDTVLTN
jgi:hypothetical protein